MLYVLETINLYEISHCIHIHVCFNTLVNEVEKVDTMR